MSNRLKQVAASSRYQENHVKHAINFNRRAISSNYFIAVAGHINNNEKPIMESFVGRLSLWQWGITHSNYYEESLTLLVLNNEERCMGGQFLYERCGGELGACWYVINESNLFRLFPRRKRWVGMNMKEWNNFFVQFY